MALVRSMVGSSSRLLRMSSSILANTNPDLLWILWSWGGSGLEWVQISWRICTIVCPQQSHLGYGTMVGIRSVHRSDIRRFDSSQRWQYIQHTWKSWLSIDASVLLGSTIFYEQAAGLISDDSVSGQEFQQLPGQLSYMQCLPIPLANGLRIHSNAPISESQRACRRLWRLVGVSYANTKFTTWLALVLHGSKWFFLHNVWIGLAYVSNGTLLIDETFFGENVLNVLHVILDICLTCNST